MENSWLVFTLNLYDFSVKRQRSQEFFYYTTPTGLEVDFYLPEQQQLVQVTQNLNSPTTRTRELRALKEAVRSIKVKSALILSSANEDNLEVNGVPVAIRSTAEWLLSVHAPVKP